MDQKCFICGDPAETECFKDESGFTLYVCEQCNTPADQQERTSHEEAQG